VNMNSKEKIPGVEGLESGLDELANIPHETKEEDFDGLDDDELDAKLFGGVEDPDEGGDALNEGVLDGDWD
jgi:hypothetical protein